MKLSKSTIITVPATPGGTAIGDQATLRGKKLRGIVALAGNHPDGRALVAPATAYLTLARAGGELIQDDLPMAILLPSANGGLLQEFGDETVDWTKSSVKALPAGLVAFSVIYE